MRRKPFRDITFSGYHQLFPCELTSEERLQKLRSNDVWLPKSGICFWLVVPRGKFALTNQKHYPHLRYDTSSVWNLCARSSDFVSWLKQWWRHGMSAVISGYNSRGFLCFCFYRLGVLHKNFTFGHNCVQDWPFSWLKVCEIIWWRVK